MTPDPGPRLAIVGSESLRAREIKTALATRKFPLRSIEFYDPGVEAEYSRLTEFRGEPKVVHRLDPALLEGLDLVFLASDPATNRLLGGEAVRGQFRALDLDETFNGDEGVPLVVAGVNEAALRSGGASLIANPNPITVFLSHLVRRLDDRFGVERGAAFALQPASAFGEDGVQELADQSFAMLGGSAKPRKVFPDQIAFSLLSRTEKPGRDGFSERERRISGEIRRVLERPDLELPLSIVQAPVFHTYAVMTRLELRDRADVKGVASAFRGRGPFKLATGESPPTAASVAGQDKIFIGQVKVEPAPARGCWIWLLADNLTAGSALNALEIARALFPPAPQAS